MKGAEEVRELVEELIDRIEADIMYGHLDEMSEKAYELAEYMKAKDYRLASLAGSIYEVRKHLCDAFKDIQKVLNVLNNAIEMKDEELETPE